MKQKERETIGFKSQVGVNTMSRCTHSENHWGLAPSCFPFFLILLCSINVLLILLCFRASNLQNYKNSRASKPTLLEIHNSDWNENWQECAQFSHNSSGNHSTSDGMFLLLNNFVSLHVNLKIYFPPCSLSMLQLIQYFILFRFTPHLHFLRSHSPGFPSAYFKPGSPQDQSTGSGYHLFLRCFYIRATSSGSRQASIHLCSWQPYITFYFMLQVGEKQKRKRKTK